MQGLVGLRDEARLRVLRRRNALGVFDAVTWEDELNQGLIRCRMWTGRPCGCLCVCMCEAFYEITVCLQALTLQTQTNQCTSHVTGFAVAVKLKVKCG